AEPELPQFRCDGARPRGAQRPGGARPGRTRRTRGGACRHRAVTPAFPHSRGSSTTLGTRLRLQRLPLRRSMLRYRLRKGTIMNGIQMTFQGNAGDKPQLCDNGTRPFARVNVASTCRIRQEGEWTDGETQWVQVKAWGRLAENMAASIRKGDSLVVTGTYRMEEYTNDEGATFKTVDVHAGCVGFDPRRTRHRPLVLCSEDDDPATTGPPRSESPAAQSGDDGRSGYG